MPQLVNWINQLKNYSDWESIMEFFVQSVEFPILYFEYLKEPAWLILPYKSSSVSTNHTHQSVCLRLYELDISFDPSQLYRPSTIPAVDKEIIKHLGNVEYQCYPLVFNNHIKGFFAVPKQPVKKDKPKPDDYFFILDYYLKNTLWMQKWKQESTKDELTNGLNKKAFLKVLFTEVSRARRLNLPVSVMVMQIDQWSDLKSVYGNYQAYLFLKALSKNLTRDMRVYDTLGCLSNGRLAIILPHTSERGAGQKAEKIRWTLQSSDFSKVFSQHNRLSISLGLVEYPKVGRTAENLLRYVEQALSFARKECGGNITAVAGPSVGFKPDFYVKDHTAQRSIQDLT